MKNSKKWIAVLALALAAAVAWGADKGAWDEGYRRAVEEAVQRAGEGMGSVSPWDGATVAILPIHGDEDGFVSELLKIAMTDAGVACVQLEGDPVWEPIGRQLVWNERSSDILDPETVRLISERTMKSATVLLTGSVRKTTSRTGREGAMLTLHATDVATTVHAWGGVFKSGQAPQISAPEPIVEAPMAMNVEVRVDAAPGAEQEGDEIGVYARGRLAALGYRVGTRQEADLSLTLAPTSALFDREGEWQVYQGTLHTTLELLGRDGHVLGEVNLSGKGVPGLDDEGHRNLAFALERQLGAWLDRTLDPKAAEYVATRLEMRLADRVEVAADHGAIVDIRQAIEKLPGVRSAEVASLDAFAGRVAYKVVYKPVDVPDGIKSALMAANPELMDKSLWW